MEEVEEEEEEEDEGRRGLVHYRLLMGGRVGGMMSGRKEVERAEWEGAEEWQGEAAAVGLATNRFAGDWCPPPLLLLLSFLSPL